MKMHKNTDNSMEQFAMAASEDPTDDQVPKAASREDLFSKPSDLYFLGRKYLYACFMAGSAFMAALLPLGELDTDTLLKKSDNRPESRGSCGCKSRLPFAIMDSKSNHSAVRKLE
jgi:hypothetical protein